MSSKQKVKVSIIIPVYNAREYIQECIQSIQRQTMKELEIVCVDDGSKDDSFDILKEFQKTDRRIRILQQTNQGAGAARNLALKNANGEFVCFIDADDCWMDDEALERLYTGAVSQNVEICGGCFFVNKNGMIQAMNIYGCLDWGTQGEKVMKYAEYQYDYHYQNYIYRKKLLLDNHIVFPAYRRYEDPPFFVKAMSAAETFCIINVPFYCYRVGYKKIQYTESMMADQMQGMIDNLCFSRKNGLKKLHRITYYRILEACNRGIKDFVAGQNTVLFQKLSEANDEIEWKWLEATCKINERILRPLADMQKNLRQESGETDIVCSEKWIFPTAYLENGSKIILYGAGEVGKCYFRQLQKNETLHLCAWADRNYDKNVVPEYELISPRQLTAVDFDYVVIGVAEIVAAMEIMDNLQKLGIPAGKVVWDIGR